MAKKIIRTWKKVYESDLPYVVSELKETIEKPALIVLNGEVGTGKTTFSKIFIGNGGLQSPTYSIVTETPTVAHADFYRLEDPEEIIHLELNLYGEGKEYFLVEWGNKFLSLLDKEFDERFHFFELLFEMNTTTKLSSRNYTLRQLERI